MNDEQLVHVVQHVLIHAQAEEPRECCGVVVLQDAGPVYIACTNLARKSEHFIIDPACYASAEDSGRVIAIAHSHVYEPPVPSLADRAGIERTGLPWIIVNYPLGTYTITRPSGFSADLIARPFVHGVHDCYALVRDYFAGRGVKLADYPRSFGWWDDPHGPDLYRDNFAREGFVQVDAGPMDAGKLARLKPCDLLLMNIRAHRENHMAVYVGDGVILHHLIEQLSRREAYQEFYQRRTTAVLRHKSFMENSDAHGQALR